MSGSGLSPGPFAYVTTPAHAPGPAQPALINPDQRSNRCLEVQSMTKYLIAALIAILLGSAIIFQQMYIRSLDQQIKDKTEEVDRLTRTVKENKRVFEEAIAAKEAAAAIATKERDAERARADKIGRIKDELKNTPPASRAPVSPDVQRVIDGLWND